MIEKKQPILTIIVGANIARRRKEKGLTQATFSEYLDITQESLSRMESGNIAPKFSRLPRIAEGLNCLVTDLFRHVDDPTQEKAFSMAEQLSRLNPEFQDIVVALVDKTVQVFLKQNK